jgi:hypothetical protein
MKTEHTPGPWLLLNPAFTRVHGLTTAEIHTSAHNGHGEWIAYVRGESDQIREANARLIAAAPELLHALKDIVDTIGDSDDCNGNPIRESYKAQFSKANELIKRIGNSVEIEATQS